MMKNMWNSNPADRPTFETIRQKLSGFLEVTSDSYGYIQVSREYGAFYGIIEPHPATAPEAESGPPSTSGKEPSAPGIEPPSAVKPDPYLVSEPETSSISRKKFQMTSEKELDFNSEGKLHFNSAKGFQFTSETKMKSKSSIEILDETVQYQNESIA